jgi:hypothetical protein
LRLSPESGEIREMRFLLLSGLVVALLVAACGEDGQQPRNCSDPAEFPPEYEIANAADGGLDPAIILAIQAAAARGCLTAPAP